MKFSTAPWAIVRPASHPARGAWIEIIQSQLGPTGRSSHPARGAWIEIACAYQEDGTIKSHPARGAWIEINKKCYPVLCHGVAPRKGCVD